LKGFITEGNVPQWSYTIENISHYPSLVAIHPSASTYYNIDDKPTTSYFGKGSKKKI